MIREVLVANIVEVVVIWILSHAPIVIRPGQDILNRNVREGSTLTSRVAYHSVLFIFNCFHSNLGQEVVVNQVCGQMRLDW